MNIQDNIDITTLVYGKLLRVWGNYLYTTENSKILLNMKDRTELAVRKIGIQVYTIYLKLLGEVLIITDTDSKIYDIDLNLIAIFDKRIDYFDLINLTGDIPHRAILWEGQNIVYIPFTEAIVSTYAVEDNTKLLVALGYDVRSVVSKCSVMIVSNQTKEVLGLLPDVYCIEDKSKTVVLSRVTNKGINKIVTFEK